VRPAGRDAPRWLVQTNTHHILYLVSESGRAAAVVVETLPEAEKFSEGIQLEKACAFESSEKLAGCFSTPPKDERMAERYVLTVSRAGLVKKTVLEELPGQSSQTFVLAKVNGGDALASVMLTDNDADIFLFTAQGMSIRFSEQEVRPMGLVAAGVNGIKLKAGDVVVSGAAASGGKGEVLLLTTGGKGWRLALDEFPQQARYGQGIIAAKLPRGETLIGGVVGAPAQQALIHFRQAASKNIKINDAALAKRLRSAEAIEAVKQGDAVLGLTSFADQLAFWVPKAPEKKPRKPRAAAKKE
jgi:DNA gyrase subunit A